LLLLILINCCKVIFFENNNNSYILFKNIIIHDNKIFSIILNNNTHSLCKELLSLKFWWLGVPPCGNLSVGVMKAATDAASACAVTCVLL